MRRDTQRLRELGYDVQSRPGPGAGYHLRPGTKIPPLLLSADEVATIITSLLVLETWSPDDPTASVARSKLEQTLPPALRRRAAATAISTQILQEPPAPVDWALASVSTTPISPGGSPRVWWSRTGTSYGTGSGTSSASTSTEEIGACSGWIGCSRPAFFQARIRPGSSRSRRSRAGWPATSAGSAHHLMKPRIAEQPVAMLRNHLSHIPDARRFQPRSHESAESASLAATDGTQEKGERHD